MWVTKKDTCSTKQPTLSITHSSHMKAKIWTVSLDFPNFFSKLIFFEDIGLNNCVIVERLFSSALMVLISQKDPRVMHVYHFTSRNIICDHKFNKSILTVRLNRERIVVCLEDCIFIFNLKDMKMMHNIQDTPNNKLGVIDLTSSSGHALIAYPGSTDTGSVHLFDAINLSSVNTFVAHEGTLACLKFNPEGTMIATASLKGTVIRVYQVSTGNRLFEFRRGVSRCVTIYSLCFSSDSKYLSSSSNTETVHVFKLEKIEGDSNQPWVSFFYLCSWHTIPLWSCSLSIIFPEKHLLRALAGSTPSTRPSRHTCPPKCSKSGSSSPRSDPSPLRNFLEPPAATKSLWSLTKASNTWWQLLRTALSTRTAWIQREESSISSSNTELVRNRIPAASARLAVLADRRLLKQRVSWFSKDSEPDCD